MLKLDHLAVLAGTLDDGRAMIEAALGTPLQPGGQHRHFGTHNLLLGLEDGLYLEVIAVDNTVPRPACPRWFDLDRLSGPPRLGNWICQVDDLDAAVAKFPHAGIPVSLSRGDLRWQMAVPQGGILPYDNMFPALMEWHCDDHPAKRLAPSGCQLERLVIRHPRAAILEREIRPVLPDPLVIFETGQAGMQAELSTPHGRRILQ